MGAPCFAGCLTHLVGDRTFPASRDCARAPISRRCARLELAVCIPGRPSFGRSAQRHRASPPHQRPVVPARVARSTARLAHRQARDAAYASPFVCHTPARIRSRHPHRAGIARPFGRQGDDNLHARAQIVAAARSVRSTAWRATTATITNDEPYWPITRRLRRVLSGKIGVPPRHDRQQREKEHSNADSRTCCDQ